MAIKVKKVKDNSILSEQNVEAGDLLVSINDKEINDNLDYRFYASEEDLKLEFKRGDKFFNLNIEKEFYEDMGLKFYPMQYRRCACNCIFCFIDQMHPDSRPSLKIKEDDYRLSFMFGNFITLVNINQNDYKRILKQRLSPLYISVHTTNDKLRKKMMRYKKNFSIMEKLKYLASNNIMMHTQIVLVPQYNDGEELEKTVKELANLYHHIQTIGIVPVGLTKYRENLPKIKAVDVKQSQKLINQVDKWRSGFFEEFGGGIVQLADEFYLKAKKPIPPADYYEGYAQIENGIGMVRQFLDAMPEYVELINFNSNPDSISIITAELIYPVTQKFAEEIEKYYDVPVNVIEVKNKYLGENVTVSGLLAAKDVIEALNSQNSGALILIPRNMFNTDELTLDDKKVECIERETGKEIQIL
ncbi:MAG: DUF512 domain-containing protein [Candidatus Cloacimonetes bacterium]|nr:DUF512 domain-containing protein [Candidatus Cloacimonadota bacterium]MBS3767615.1 DUF512 domain-containing protein [Candidatus Cloacimonadota bacterium]